MAGDTDIRMCQGQGTDTDTRKCPGQGTDNGILPIGLAWLTLFLPTVNNLFFMASEVEGM